MYDCLGAGMRIGNKADVAGIAPQGAGTVGNGSAVCQSTSEAVHKAPNFLLGWFEGRRSCS